ncbi:MAG TPA: DUF5703 domain-containing protein [Opitutaceae bacterium]|nr:DUF5703 domain-containing protein [Opitutaceae bacterium]
MKLMFRCWFLISLLCALARGAAAVPSDGATLVAQRDVVWTTPGASEQDSLPLGNGDLAANVWTEGKGDLVLLLAKSDAWTELGKLVKLGRVRIHLEGEPFVDPGKFREVLRLETGDIEIAAGDTTYRIWIDANRPALHVEIHSAAPRALRATLETWRTPEALGNGDAEKAGMSEIAGIKTVALEPDTIFPAGPDALTWCHFNRQSVYPIVLQQEHLGAVENKYPDPLLRRCFGALLTGRNLRSEGDQSLVSSSPQTDFRMDLVALTQRPAASPEAWRRAVELLRKSANPADLVSAWKEHCQWWTGFWNRSWIDVTGGPESDDVAQGYAMQRFMMAASSRGELPVKFNGGLFTVGRDVPAGTRSNAQTHNPDYRAWGNSYWNQNNRLLYWPLIQTGDYDLLRPWFEMYLAALPLARDRTAIYYHHDGASFPETMFFWGLPNLHDFGWNNPSNEIQSRWQRYHIQGTLEVIAQMLDYYDYTGDEAFAAKSLVPFADAIVTYYAEHYPHGSDGKLCLVPAQSLETYQLIAVNPTPDLAGLKSDLPRLLGLPERLTTSAQRAAWSKLLHVLPDLPMGTTDAKGKTPPLGIGDPHGTPILLPAGQYGKTGNSENPELYVTFPYRLYGIGKPDLKLARDTYAARRSPQKTCWGQDGTEAAVLGLTSEARAAVVSEFTNYGNQRFRWFWKPAHDWIPDLDNGGSGMITLQEMLLQADGRKLYLLPAWPADWSADFKLHAPLATVVEGRIEHGKLVALHVTPKSRAADVVVVGPETTEHPR